MTSPLLLVGGKPSATRQNKAGKQVSIRLTETIFWFHEWIRFYFKNTNSCTLAKCKSRLIVFINVYVFMYVNILSMRSTIDEKIK